MKHILSIISLSLLGFALAFSQSGVGGKGGFGGKGGVGGGTTAGGATIAIVQRVIGSSSSTPGCNGVGATCTLPFSSTGSGHLLGFGTASTNNVTLNSISAGGSFVHCSNCSQDLVATGAVDGGWVLSSSSGVTSIVLTMSGNHGGMQVEAIEASCTGGTATWTKDSNAAATGSGTNPTATSPFSGQALTLSGAKDLAMEIATADVNLSTPFVGSPWLTNFDNLNGAGASSIINVSSAPTPSWTAAGIGQATFAGMAWTCQ